MLLLVELVPVSALWVSASRWMRESAHTSNTDRRVTVAAVLFVLCPPTLVFLVLAVVIGPAAGTPLVRSLWGGWWLEAWSASVLLAACYLALFVGSLVVQTRPSARIAVGLALMSSCWGTLLMMMASPRG